MPRVGREVTMVLRFVRGVTMVFLFKCKVAVVLQVDYHLVGGGWVALPFFCFSVTTYNTDQLTKIKQSYVTTYIIGHL